MANNVAALLDKSLYEIQDHLQALFDSVDMIDSPELREQAELDIQRYLEASVRKVDGVANYLSLCEGQQATTKAEIKRLEERAAAWEAREERVRKYVQDVMEKAGEKKLEGQTNTFLLRAAPASVVILDEAEIPAEFKRTTVTVQVDKDAIKKAINAGQDVSGADLSMGKSVLVRK